MAALDKALVPALFYTSLSKASESASSHTVLAAQWAEFKSKFFDHRFSAYYATIDGYLTAADGAATGDAHTEYENIRNEWKAMREAFSYDYFQDYLTQAHHDMEAMLNAGDCAAFSTAVIAFRTSWGALVTSYGDGSAVASLYNFSTEKSAFVTGKVNTLTTNAASPDFDECTVVATSIAITNSSIKSHFVPFFLAFGDFYSPFIDDMVAMERRYVPSLMMTGNAAASAGQVTAALDMVVDFEVKWLLFEAHYPTAGPAVPAKLNWISRGNDFDEIQGWITAALTKLIALNDGGVGGDMTLAHADLENVRLALQTFRSTYDNYDFIIDYLTAYHSLFELALTEIGNGEAMDTAVVRAHLLTAEAELALLKSAVADMDTDVYPLWLATLAETQALLATHEATYAIVRAALDAFDAAPGAGTAADVADVAINLSTSFKKTFAAFFKKFGNWTSPV